MNRELEWSQVPVIKIAEKDRELARMILSGTPQGEDHKMTRGFLYYNIIEGEFVMVEHYEKFLQLLQAYIFAHWNNITNWDEAIAGKKLADLEWDPHLEAYYLLKLAEKRLSKIAQ